ncbi:MAG: hypothetical protein JWO93_66 [Micrococcaceae bacterium]|nr:hypothetical protein [Micrococcaceae bacterium]
MRFLDIITTAVGNSIRSKTRTILTVVAIFIGAFTLTITSAIGTGISGYIDNQVGAFGAADVLSITKTSADAAPAGGGPAPYDPRKVTLEGGFPGDGSESAAAVLTPDDLVIIGKVTGILDVSAVQQVTPRYIEYGNRGKFELTVNPNSFLTTPDLASGSQLRADGDQNQILITTAYVGSLGFADAAAAAGQTVTIGITDHQGLMHEVQATVVGVQNETLLASGAGLNQALTDNLHRLQNTGVPESSSTGSLLATARFNPAASGQDVDAMQAALAGKGYTALTVADQIGIIQTVISGIIGVLNAFAVIALVAAGFGIINTLLMSVQERTREIGLMKAMGMGAGRIYALFSIEAVFIGFLGSVIGVLAAIGTGAIANSLLAGTVLADLQGLVVLRFAPGPVAAVIGLVMIIAFLAGTLPARRASRQNPIEALRYE